MNREKIISLFNFLDSVELLLTSTGCNRWNVYVMELRSILSSIEIKED